MVLAAVMSTLNKLFDVVPELLIGVAIDVIVRGDDSFLSSLFGVTDRFDQLVVLAVLNVGAWILESASDYVAQVLWRGLAQAIQHTELIRHVGAVVLAAQEGTRAPSVAYRQGRQVLGGHTTLLHTNSSIWPFTHTVKVS